MSKPREIEIEYGWEGQLMWPPNSPKHEVKEKILFREVTPQDEAKALHAAIEHFKKVNPHMAKDTGFHTEEKSLTIAAFMAGFRFASGSPEGNAGE